MIRYIAGIFCAVVSHPADTMVSKMSQDKSGASAIMKKLGWAGLWKGLGTRIIMIGKNLRSEWPSSIMNYIIDLYFDPYEVKNNIIFIFSFSILSW